MSQLCIVWEVVLVVKRFKNWGCFLRLKTGSCWFLFFFNSVVLQSFVTDVKCYNLVVVAAVKDWHSNLTLAFGQYYLQFRDLLECTVELQKQDMCDFHKWKWRRTLILRIKGRSCPGSLSQAGVPHGTSCRSCQSGGYKRTVEPARRLSCYPAASPSTSIHSLRWTHTELCNRCWSEERRAFTLEILLTVCSWNEFHVIIYWRWNCLCGHIRASDKRATSFMKRLREELASLLTRHSQPIWYL